jgi:hypothetical protein
MARAHITFDWPAILGLAGAALASVVVATLLCLPLLSRLCRPEELRTE